VRFFILARLLTPAQFGTYGVATLALSFIEAITETGVNLILIQEDKSLFNKYLNSAWIVSIGRGMLMFLIIFLSAPFIGNFFNNQDSVVIIKLIALVPLIKGFINPSIVLLQRDLHFKKEVIIRTTVSWIGGIVAIVAALIWHSPISLAIGMIVEAVAEVVITMLYIAPRPHFDLEKSYLSHIFHRGKWITMAGTFNYLFQQLDDIVVGRRLGDAALGGYQMAYRIAILPITEVSDVFNRVTLPVYIAIGGDQVRLRTAFWKVLSTMTAISIPFGIVLALFPTFLVKVFLGSQWLSIVSLLPLLAVFGVLRAISGACYPLFLAVKKQEYVTMFTLISIIGLAVTIWPFVTWWGTYGAALAAMVGAVLALPYLFYRIWTVLYAPRDEAH
jgi:O-antigen/teichoic acid export membrane protein